MVRVLALEGLGLVPLGVRLKACMKVSPVSNLIIKEVSAHTQPGAGYAEPHVSLVKGQGPLG